MAERSVMAQIFVFGRVMNDLVPKESQSKQSYVCFDLMERTKNWTQFYQVWAWDADVTRLMQFKVKKGSMIWLAGSQRLVDVRMKDGKLEKKLKVNQGEVPPILCGKQPPCHCITGRMGDGAAGNSLPESTEQNLQRQKRFLRKLICEDCGAFYGSKVWDSIDQYRKQHWQSNRKFSNHSHSPMNYFAKRCITQQILQFPNAKQAVKSGVPFGGTDSSMS